MQIFEVLEIREYPYFLTVDVKEGELVRDIINNLNSHKVYLLVNHDNKRIWTYNGINSSIKLQLFGGILAGMLRNQVGGFYRIFSLNKYSAEDTEFQEILNKPIGEGRARSIDKSDFPAQSVDLPPKDILIHNPRLNKALERIRDYPSIIGFKRSFLIVGGTLYSDEKVMESFLKDEKVILEEVKLGRLNNGFTFFNDRNYSIRVIVSNQTIQGIELYVPEYENLPIIRLKTPVIKEEKFSNPGNIKDVLKAFQIPDSLPDEEVVVHDLTGSNKDN
ncbi:MAG: hypothetical protein ACTSWH_13455 [Promethearchaeota archaeon]